MLTAMLHKGVSVALCLAGAVASAEPAVPNFSAVVVPEHVYDGGWEHFVGGGVASFDCNGDQFPDLYAAGGSNPAQLLVNEGQKALSFRSETPDALALTGVTGAYPLDVNGDSIWDLAILRVGKDVLMQGLGDCRFAEFTDIGFDSPDSWSTAFSATWEDGQSLPTLAFGPYVDRSDPNGPFEACDDPMLYRPDGGAYGPALRLEPGHCALSMLFSDWNRSGRADLRISNDRHYYVRDGQEQLWAMEAEPRLYTEQEGWARFSIWGMGIASRDISGDGHPEVYLTSMGDQKLQIFQPGGGPDWRDATFERGTTAHRPHLGGDGRPSTGWHAAFGDVNNDGRDDIFVAKGNVEQMPDAAMRDPNSLLMQQADGQFVEVAGAAGVASMAKGRGAALVDLNLDGALDLAVVNRGALLEVFQNVGASGNWLLVDISAKGPNTKAVGAFIELRSAAGVQTREITVGGGHVSGDGGLHHFGLGKMDSAEIRVLRDSQVVLDWQSVAANQVVNLAF
ncbi:MAG: FG-GAP repeat domain-containing protein [Arenibacterium sp.]